MPGVEWAKLSAQSDAEGKLSAAKIGQDYFTWLNDAVAHHVYRIEQMQAAAHYQADELAAAAAGRPTPDKNDPRYAVQRERPTITRPAGQGSEGPSSRRQYRP